MELFMIEAFIRNDTVSDDTRTVGERLNTSF